jgi:hypothetical protein
MRSELRIDFRIQHIAHALDHARFRARYITLDLRRADVELATGGVGFEVDGGVVQPAGALAIDVEQKAGAFDRPLAAGQIGRLAELQLAIGRRRTGLQSPAGGCSGHHYPVVKEGAENAAARVRKYRSCLLQHQTPAYLAGETAPF